MKIERELVPVKKYETIYVAQDGTRFYNRADAIRHDAITFAGTRYVEQGNNIELPDDETWMRIFNITYKEDWDYLYYTEWEQNISYGIEYTGPGWYGSIKHDGGDYADSYEIIKIDADYLKKYENFIKEIKQLTSL